MTAAGEDIGMKTLLLQKTGLQGDNSIPARRNPLTDAFKHADVIKSSKPWDHNANGALTGSVR